MAANLDLYATFAALSGGTQPAGKPGYISRDLTGTLCEKQPSPRTRWLFTGGGAEAFRSGQYKIHFSTKMRSSNPDTRQREPVTKHDPPLLFDLHSDVGEQTSLSAAQPAITARLLDEWNAFRQQ